MPAAETDVKLLSELTAEKEKLDPTCLHSIRLLDEEIKRLKSPNVDNEKDLVDTHDDKPSKVKCLIKLPVEKYPKVNFVGKLIGPGGAILKGIQEMTGTRIAVLGKGSQRDKKKAEELAASGDPKWAHMNLPLHVKICAFAPVTQAYFRVGQACNEIVKLIQVDEEAEAQQQQMMMMGGGQGMGHRGGSRGGRGGPVHRGMGRGRGGNSRGASRNSSNTRGNGNARGGSRGGAASGRGGNGRYAQKNQQSMMMSSAAGAQQAAMGGQDYGVMQQGYEGSYEDPAMYEGYGPEYADPSAYSQEADQSYMQMYNESAYGAEQQYDMSAYSYSGADAYGGGAYATQAAQVDPYSNGAGDQQAQYSTAQQSKPYRGKMMPQRGGGTGGGRGAGGGGRSAGKPY